jgi:hypothetical protein
VFAANPEVVGAALLHRSTYLSAIRLNGLAARQMSIARWNARNIRSVIGQTKEEV